MRYDASEMSPRLAVALSLSVLSAGALAADDVVLTNGKTFEGVDIRMDGDTAAILDTGNRAKSW